MERIKEAIRLAKEHRQTQALTPGSSSPMPVSAEQKPRPNGRGVALDFDLLPTRKSHLAENRIVVASRGNPHIAAFDMLRTKVVLEMNANGWQVALMTSPTAGCGKTVSIINLALSISRQPDQNVVLIDLDLRKPRVISYIGVSPKYELQDVLNGEVALSQALFGVDIGGPQLAFLANKRPLEQPVEALVSRQMQDILATLRSSMPRPIVLIDMPPVLMSDDVIAFLPQVDCCLLAVAEGQSTLKEIQNSEKLLSGTNQLGCVLTKSTEKVQTYY